LIERNRILNDQIKNTIIMKLETNKFSTHGTQIKSLMKTKLLNHAFVAFVFTLAIMLNSNNISAQNLPVPEVKPLSGIPTLDTSPFTLSNNDLKVEEYIAKGLATSYKAVGEWSSDGKWNIQPADTASYTTRFVVIRPSQAEKFNGVVVIEWLNVTGGFDFSPARIMMWRELARNGSVWIGVSAQPVGISGGTMLGGQQSSMYLKKLNAERYGLLRHPGDAFSYDIYTQLGRFIKGPNASKALGGLIPKRIISLGESQSAIYLTTYINAVHPVTKVYDGFLNYSKFSFGAPINSSPNDLSWVNTKEVAKIRTDLNVPVIVFETESDVVGSGMFIGYHAARQNDTKLIRVWEVPGTAHADSYLMGGNRFDKSGAPYDQIAQAWPPVGMRGNVNNNPAHHYVVQAAMAALQNWVLNGISAPMAKRIELKETGEIAVPVRLVRDENGNVKGGIRSPWVEVPTTKYSGEPKTASDLSGSSEPFSTEKLDSLYPGGKAEYMKKFEKALDKQIKAGFILAADREEILGVAKLSYQGSH
jgi:hypothetical protein